MRKYNVVGQAQWEIEVEASTAEQAEDLAVEKITGGEWVYEASVDYSEEAPETETVAAP